MIKTPNTGGHRIFACLVVPCLLFSTITKCQVKPKYNVILICTHDMCDRVGFLGNPEPYTPNFKRLASHGMVFHNNYAQYPLCNPGRTTFLSGWRPDKTQVFSNQTRPRSTMGDSVKFLPEYFHLFGYRTERYGHVMHGPMENDCSWDYAEPGERNAGDLSTADDEPSGIGSWWISDESDSKSEGGVEAQHYIARLQEGETKPFFYALGFVQTHDPFAPNIGNWNKNGDPSVQEHLPDENGDTTRYTGNGSGNIILPKTPKNDRDDVPEIAFTKPPIKKTRDEWKRSVHAYEGDLSQLDTYLGWVLDDIDSQNLWSNTVIVFWTDHGQNLGEHEGVWGKMNLFDESLHVPLIICAPGKKPGVSYQLTENVDVYATLSELCGLPPPPGMEGSSLVPLLDNPSFSWKRAVFSQVNRGSDTVMGRQVLTQQFAYHSWGNKGEELYDHFADPNEYTNLASNPAYVDTLKKMRILLSQGWTKSLPPVYKLKTFYRDFDKDGFGNFNDSIQAYARPTGYIINSADCNDSAAAVNPGVKEICDNLIDDNCDGRVDENRPSASITVLGNLDICQTDSVVLRANWGVGLSYQWSKYLKNIQGATLRFYTAKDAGNYRVAVTDTNGCTRTSKVTIVTNSCDKDILISNASASGLRVTSNSLLVFPNPSSGELTVSYKSDKIATIQLVINDNSGKEVMSKRYSVVKGTNLFYLDLTHFASGFYHLEIINNNKRNSKKFIIQK